MRVAIVAGEMSGDLLGAGLVRALRKRWPHAQFEGIGGPAMLKEGFRSHYPMERLSVMGLVEVLGHLPGLLRIRRELVKRYTANPPDVFIGIDSPDFNLGLEERLRRAGVKTVHYVSPTVWAWRQGRIRQIKRAVDLMLTLFPFEADFYVKHGVAVEFVGHPAADRYPLEHDVGAARARLGIEQATGPIVAMLPGSRLSEVRRLGPLYAQVVVQLRRTLPECRFLAPMATPAVGEVFAEQLAAEGVAEQVRLLQGQSDLAMGAADAVLAASGTATLEAMLLKRPAVIAYKVAPLSYWLFRRMLKVRYIALPNLLADAELMPEFIQQAATPESLTAAVAGLLTDPTRALAQQERLETIHRTLRRDADERAAEAIVRCLS